MKTNLLYLRHLVLHKYYVFVAGRKLKVPIIRLLLHDFSKFLPVEWKGYAGWYHGGPNYKGWCRESDNSDKDAARTLYNEAWNHHLKHNKHHWNYYVLETELIDGKQLIPLAMPSIYVKEMIADWMAAGVNQTGDWYNLRQWYPIHGPKMVLHPSTRFLVECCLKDLGLLNTTVPQTTNETVLECK